MSWNYLPELEEAFLHRDFSAIIRLEQSRSIHIAALFCFSGKEICVCPSSPSGTMSRRSERIIRNARTTSDGCGQSPENSVFQEVFLARIFRLAERVGESPDQNQASGSKWLALSMKYDRDSHSWKTVRCSPRADLKWSLHHWPGWGMMRDGACWALEISDIRSSASASGFWGSIARNMGRDMTPGTSKAALLRSTYGAQKNSLLCRMLREIDLYPTVSLCELLMDWPDRWSRLEPLAMDRFLRWRRSHGDSSQAA